MTTDAPNAKTPTSSPAWLSFFGSFSFRLLLLAVVMFAFISGFGVNIGSIGQGLSYSLVGVAVFLTFRILEFPDLSVDASFPIGGAVCATLIVAGVHAEVTPFAAFFAGAMTGLVTALINQLFNIEGLLASIIVITGAYTISLRIMDGSNIPLMGERTILTPYQQPMRAWVVETLGDEARRHSNNLVEIIVFMVVVISTMLILNWFMHTEFGLAVRASGRNSQMVRALGMDHRLMIVAVLMISNGLAGMAGALTVQQLGFADVALGFGAIIRGLAAVMIGEVLLSPKSIGQRILASAIGMIVFDVSRAWVFTALDLPTSDIRLVSAIVVLIALAAPNINQRWQDWQQRRKRQDKVKNEAA